jgi:hypothetical protein
MQSTTNRASGKQPARGIKGLPRSCAAELGQDPIQQLPIDQVRPSLENERLYRPVDPHDPENVTLVASVRAQGVLEPLIVTLDGWIASGHRRHAAARLAGLTTVPCRIVPIRKDKHHDRFMRLLRDCNRQRVKTFDEKLREEIVSTSPTQAYQSLIEHRQEQSALHVETLALRGRKTRAALSSAKGPFLEAVQTIIKERKPFWPLSDRQIHYALLSAPPLIHASKPGSVYANTLPSYKALVDLPTRARLAGLIPMHVIQDDLHELPAVRQRARGTRLRTGGPAARDAPGRTARGRRRGSRPRGVQPRVGSREGRRREPGGHAADCRPSAARDFLGAIMRWIPPCNCMAAKPGKCRCGARATSTLTAC